MGSINIKHTGSGSDIALSSDGTSLLLDGTAIGGGGGGSAFTTPEVKTSDWSVTNADKGKVYIVDTDNLTLTLPEDSTLDSDWFIRIYTKGQGFQPSYGQVGDLTIDPQYNLHGGRVNGNTNWIMRARQGGILFVDPEASDNFLFDTHSTNWDIDVNSTANANRANATGWGSIAISGQATASGTGAISIGYLSNATGNDSIAIGGNSAQAVATDAIALGNSYASGTSSFAAAIGNNTSSYGAQGTNSIAIGHQAKVNAGTTTGIAIGDTAWCYGTQSIAIGYGAVASAKWAVSLNRVAEASAQGSAALGYNAKASGLYSTALAYARSSGDYSFAAGIGDNSTTYGSKHIYGVALGYQAVTTADKQIALGSSTAQVKVSGAYTLPTSDGTNGQVLTTDGSGAVTFADAGGGGGADLYAVETTGSTTPTATGTLSLAIGSEAEASGLRSIGIGRDATASATNSVAIGTDSVAGISNSIAIQGNISGSGTAASIAMLGATTAQGVVQIGQNGYVQGQYATAVGYNADVYSSGSNGTALGHGAQVNGSGATALTNSYATGADSFAAAIANNSSSYGSIGANSIAIGYQAKAEADRSTAIGYTAQVTGNHASAYGHGSSATGAGSNSLGYGSSASGSFANAIGSSAVAIGGNSVAFTQSRAGGSNSFAAAISSNSSSYGASATNAVALGYYANAAGDYSVAIGKNASATGNDTIALGGATTLVKVDGTLDVSGFKVSGDVEEKFTTLTSSSSVVAHDCSTAAIFYHTGATGDFTINLTNINSTQEYAKGIAVVVNQGATAYMPTALQIGGSVQTINWQGGSAPSGTDSGIDIISFTILNDGGTYVVLGQSVAYS